MWPKNAESWYGANYTLGLFSYDPSKLKELLSAKTLIDKALASIKNQMGIFLSNSKVLGDLKPRLEALSKASDSKITDTAKNLKNKLEAVSKIQSDLENDALNFVNTASALKARMESDPKYQFLKTPMAAWGTRMMDVLGDLLTEVGGVTPMAVSLSTRMLAQNKNVSGLASETKSLENAASGLGGLPKIQSVISGTLGAITSPLKAVLIPAVIGTAVVLALMYMPRRKS
jgi:hypothetical protein